MLQYLCEKAKVSFVPENRFHARQAALALLMMARSTSDTEVAAKLVDIAASLKDQAGELPPQIGLRPPCVQMDLTPDGETAPGGMYRS